MHHKRQPYLQQADLLRPHTRYSGFEIKFCAHKTKQESTNAVGTPSTDNASLPLFRSNSERADVTVPPTVLNPPASIEISNESSPVKLVDNPIP